MNKQELIKRVAEDSEVTQRDAGVMIDNLLNIIMTTVASGEKIQLLGFGTFESKKRSARMGRNPGTNEPVPIPETVAPVFKPGSEFKDMVRR